MIVEEVTLQTSEHEDEKANLCSRKDYIYYHFNPHSVMIFSNYFWRVKGLNIPGQSDTALLLYVVGNKDKIPKKRQKNSSDREARKGREEGGSEVNRWRRPGGPANPKRRQGGADTRRYPREIGVRTARCESARRGAWLTQSDGWRVEGSRGLKKRGEKWIYYPLLN